MNLEKYGHGGDLKTAEETYGIPADQWLDFSSNMNPWGPPDVVRTIMADRWQDIVRYPDPGVRRLRDKLSEVYGVPADCILVGNGAAELIDLVVRVLRPEATILARPSFSEYEEAVHKAGGQVLDLPLSEHNGFELTADVQRWTETAAAQGRCLFLGHPNNPTGRLIPVDVLNALASSGAPLIVDEAFMDFVPDEGRHSLMRMAAESKHVIVIRSMTKFYAVPGIRLGFLVARPELVARLQTLQTQWSVNYLAQLIGEAVLGDEAYANRTRDWLQEERPRLIGRLRELGLTVVPSAVNFLLVRLPADSGMSALQLQQEMARGGIMIRDASLFKGLGASYFRVAIRLRPENERLVEQLRAVLR